MRYIDEVKEKVVKLNPGQPEFLQAAEEVLESLRPIIDKNEDTYRRAFSKFNYFFGHYAY